MEQTATPHSAQRLHHLTETHPLACDEACQRKVLSSP